MGASASALRYGTLPHWLKGGAVEKALRARTPPQLEGGKPQTLFLQTPLDHFASSPSKKWPLRYFIDSSCLKGDGPIFVNMGGEGGGGPSSCSSKDKEYGALHVSVEHRFFGESTPFHDMSTANLKYLTVEQNLADTAAVVQAMQAKFPRAGGKKRTVASFGGSYSGATAAWFRVVYPNVTDLSISESGVVNAILAMTSFDDAIRVALGNSSTGPSPECPQRLAAVTAALERAFAAGKASKDTVKKLYNATNLIGTTLGDSDFWYAVADGAAMSDQYGGKATLCKLLAKPYAPDAAPTDAALIANFAQLLEHHYGPAFVSGCFYDTNCISNTTYDPAETHGLNARSWRWVKCNELAFLQNAPATNSMRSKHLTIDVLEKQCDMAFPDQTWARRVDSFNAYFGGAKPGTGTANGGKRPSKIFFADYSDDPWARASVDAPAPDLPYCMETCNGCGHCGSGAPFNNTCDRQEASYLKKWLAEVKK